MMMLLLHPLAIPIALTILSAIAQLAGRLYATRKIRAAQNALQRRREQHAYAIAQQQRRQDAARRRIAALGSDSDPHSHHALTPALADYAPRIWLPDRPDGGFLRRLFRRIILRSGGIDEHIPSSKRIILPKVASTAASIVYKTNSPALMRLLMPALRPALAFGAEIAAAIGRTLQLMASRIAQLLTAAVPQTGRAATVAPRLAATGGGAAGGSLGAGGGLLARLAVTGIAVIGYLIGPALAALSIYLDLRKVRRARRELAAASAAMDKYEAEAAAVTAALENISPHNANDGDDNANANASDTDGDTDAGDDNAKDNANDDDAGAAPAPPSFAAPV